MSSSTTPSIVVDAGTRVYLFVEQVILMTRKNINQKQRQGRAFLKETIFIPFFVLAFTGFLFSQINTLRPTNDVFQLHALPPLSSNTPWGIFSESANQNNANFFIQTSNLYYTPNNHAGVTALVDALKEKYPSVSLIGVSDMDELLDQYTENIFNTWAALQFNLTADQITTGLLVPSDQSEATVDFTVLLSPQQQSLPMQFFVDSTSVLNTEAALADAWWTSGYMTLQNFVSTYLAQQYNRTVPSTFSVTLN